MQWVSFSFGIVFLTPHSARYSSLSPPLAKHRMPLTKKERSKTWRKFLSTKYHLQEQGYELVIDEYVRKKLGEKRRKASYNPWMTYIKQEAEKERLEADETRPCKADGKATLDDRPSTSPYLTPTRDHQSTDTIRSNKMVIRENPEFYFESPHVDKTHYQSPHQWRQIRSLHIHPKSGRGRMQCDFKKWELPLIPKSPKSQKKEQEDDTDFFTFLSNQRKNRKLKGERPSSLVYGRIVDKPPSDVTYRSSLGLEQDKLKLCSRDPSKLLPIPTLSKEEYHKIIDGHSELEKIRQNLVQMEAEEAREYRVRKYLREKAAMAKDAESEAKIKQCLVRIKQRTAIKCLRAWNEESSKNGKMKRFLRQTLYKWVVITFSALKSYTIGKKEVKRKSATLIQRQIRRFLAVRKFTTLRMHTLAARMIQWNFRVYLARSLARRAKAKIAEDERKVKMLVKKILYRGAIACLNQWHDEAHKTALVKKMAGAHSSGRLRELLKRWKKNAYESKYFKKLAAIKIQAQVRCFLGKLHVSVLRQKLSSSIKIQKAWQVYKAKNLLKFLKQKQDETMMKIATMLQGSTKRWQRRCIQHLRLHAEKEINMRKQLRMAFRHSFRTRLLAWQTHAKQWKKDKQKAAITIQNFARSMFARNEMNLRIFESSIMVAKEVLIAERDNKVIEETEAVDPFAPVLDEDGFPVIKTPSERLVILREERAEVLADKSTEEFFDSRVLVFQQRFRMRANKKYLLRYIDSEIKSETWKVWREELAVIKAKHAKVEEMKAAEEERVREMNALFESGSAREENSQQNLAEVAYPTAGTKLHFETSSLEDMRRTIKEWKVLQKDGWMSRKTMLTWIGIGLMRQTTMEGKIACWKVVRSEFEEDDLFEINRIHRNAFDYAAGE